MKVLLVGNYLPDRQDSMQFYASMLENGLRARGHEVHLLRPPAVFARQVAQNSPLFKWLGYADKFLLFRRELLHAAAQADIVHLCDHSNAMYVPALARTPHLVTCHDILAIRSAMGHFAKNRVSITGRIFQRLIVRGLRKAPVILCVSAKTRDDLEQYIGIPRDRLRIVPNALHWPYKPLSAEICAPVLQSVGLQPNEPYFFHLGGSHWYKNRRAVIEIFAELRKLPQYAAARLLMAGAPIDAELRDIAKEHGVEDAIVEVVRPDNQRVEAFYSCAIALLFPSLEEGFGWPILESQACGCPVVTTDRRPMNEVAGGAAILIDPAKPADAARAIAKALQNATHIRGEGLRNAESYTTDRMLSQCEALYREVAAARQTIGAEHLKAHE
jgi:glycosyltransferase involved in cell wall biosynthesis